MMQGLVGVFAPDKQSGSPQGKRRNLKPKRVCQLTMGIMTVRRFTSLDAPTRWAESGRNSQLARGNVHACVTSRELLSYSLLGLRATRRPSPYLDQATGLYAQPANQPQMLTADENIWSGAHAYLDDAAGTILLFGGFYSPQAAPLTGDTEPTHSCSIQPATASRMQPTCTQTASTQRVKRWPMVGYLRFSVRTPRPA